MPNCPLLTADRWMREDEPEFARIRSQAVADLQRASRGIASIARILHNSIGDDLENDGAGSIDGLAKQHLAGAVECLSDFMYQILDEGVFDLAAIEREANHA